MAEQSWIIGSLPECDLRLEAETVSGRHCRLTARGESFLLEDLGSSNGTFVNGERLQKPRIVRRGDNITLGRVVPMPWPNPTVAVTIGRLTSNDVVIPLDTVSSHHARLEMTGGQATLIDLGSTNGTAINDPLNKITRAPLAPSDAVFFGTHRVRARELFTAFPSPRRAQTVLEQQQPEELTRAPADEDSITESMTVTATAAEKIKHQRAYWLIGGGACLLVLLLLGGKLLSTGERDSLASPVSAAASDAPHERAEARAPAGDLAPVTEAPIRDDSALVLIAVALPSGEHDVLSLGWAVDERQIVTLGLVYLRHPNLQYIALQGDSQILLSRPTFHPQLVSMSETGQAGVEEMQPYDVAIFTAKTPLSNYLKLADGSPSVAVARQVMSLSQGSVQESTSLLEKFDLLEHQGDASRVAIDAKIANSHAILGGPLLDSQGEAVGMLQPSALDGEADTVSLQAIRETLDAAKASPSGR